MIKNCLNFNKPYNVLNGLVEIENYQSLEVEAAATVTLAAKYFNGIEFDEINFLLQAVITINNVEEFMPGGW